MPSKNLILNEIFKSSLTFFMLFDQFIFLISNFYFAFFIHLFWKGHSFWHSVLQINLSVTATELSTFMYMSVRLACARLLMHICIMHNSRCTGTGRWFSRYDERRYYRGNGTNDRALPSISSLSNIVNIFALNVTIFLRGYFLERIAIDICEKHVIIRCEKTYFQS